MPIYEYACPHCRKIMSFLVRDVRAQRTPTCPHCGRPDLVRRMSRFAVRTSAKTTKKKEKEEPEGRSAEDGPPDDISPEQERRFERFMQEMSRQIDKIDENDPRQIGRFLRKFGEATGEDLGPEFNEAVRRLEAGEDPEKVEEQLAAAFGEEGEGDGSGSDYSYDDTLYDL